MDAPHPLWPAEVNMADVAREAGVSIATVSRALRDVPGVNPETRDRIRGIAEQLAYVVSPEASRLARRRTGRVAVVVPRLDIWFYAAMLASIEPELRSADLDMLVYQVDGEQQRSEFLRRLPARRKADAVILTALPMQQSEVDRLDLIGMHVAVAGGRVRDFAHVEGDDYTSARTAVAHLVGLGHRRIAMLRTSDTEGTAWSSDVERWRGWRDELAAHGVTATDDLLVTEAYGPQAASRGLDRMLAATEPPTAVFAYSDELAMGLVAAAHLRGLRVPRDLSVIGLDGHPDAELLAITTVDQGVAEQGRLVGKMVLEMLRDEDPDAAVVVPGRLVVRESTGPLPA